MHKILIFLICVVFSSCKNDKNKTEHQELKIVLENKTNTGYVFGTSYKISYNSEINYQKQIDSLFYVINKSMSTYQANSDISKLNRNETTLVDSHFIKVFDSAKKVYNDTKGAFDPTIGAVVNAWDFGPEGRIENLDSLKIDSLMVSVGYNKVSRKDYHITKPKGTFIDFNAIAKGYGVDVIGEFLNAQNIENYFVFIGGEICAKGVNVEKNKGWHVGIQDPNFEGEQSYQSSVVLNNEAMATSGTYRKFKVDDNGNRYAHIIDTKTGYPSKTNILSVSVITETCMIADAYATVFQAMGIEKVKAFLKTRPELKVFLIFENDTKELETLSLNGFF